MAKRIQIRPYPEVVDRAKQPRQWTVEEGPPMTNLQKGHMSVPMDMTEEDRTAQVHELIHAAITPHQSPADIAAKHEVSVMAIQVAEDMRNFLHAEYKGMELMSMGATVADITKSIDAAKARYKADKTDTYAYRQLLAHGCLLVSTYNGMHERVPELRELWKGLPSDVQGHASSVYHCFSNGLNPFTRTIKAAKVFHNFCNVAETTAKERERTKACFKLPPGKFGRPTDSKAFKEIVNLAQWGSPLRDYRAGRTAQWGDMRIVKLPLTVRTAASRLARKRTKRRRGNALSYAHRWATDKRIFKRTKRGRGGVTLMDVSGSMHLSIEQVDAFLEQQPTGMMAIYRGHDGKMGHLAIIGAKGYRATARAIRQYLGGSNIIDGPALAWLCKQKGPRFWVSDGIVTGINEAQTHNLITECLALQKKGRIPRLHDPESALKYLRAML